MGAVDGTAAARALIARGNCLPGFCLSYVWQAYKSVGASTSRSAATAAAGWAASDGKHPGDRNPPPGVPVWWGPKPSSAAGDVTISLGGGRVAATDYPRYGVIGTCTIDEREAQIGRPYLGWTEAIFDQPITIPALASDGGSIPFVPKPTMTPEETDLMPSFSVTRPLYLHDNGLFVWIDPAARTYRFIPAGSWEYDLIKDEEARLKVYVEKTIGRNWSDMDSQWRGLSSDQWEAAFGTRAPGGPFREVKGA